MDENNIYGEFWLQISSMCSHVFYIFNNFLIIFLQIFSKAKNCAYDKNRKKPLDGAK